MTSRARQGFARSGLAVAALAATALGLSADAAGAASSPALARVVSPAQNGVVVGSTARVVVRLDRRVTSFRAVLDGRDVTAAFRASGLTRTASLTSASGLAVGVNRLRILTKASGADDYDAVRFVVARPATGLLEQASARRGGKVTPLRVTVRARRGVQVRIAINGRGQQALTGSGRTLVVRAGADAGVRPGANSVRILAFTESGRAQVVTRTVTLPSGQPVAGAGSDFTSAVRRPGTVGLPIALAGLASSRSSTYKWRVVSAPRKARPTITGEDGRTPELVTDRPGTYEVRLTVSDADGATSSDTLTIEAQPRDPPIGVRIDTASNDPYDITIDGQKQAGVFGPGFAYVVLRRATREVVQKGAIQGADAPSLGELEKVAKDFTDPQYLVVMSAKGLAPTRARAVADLLAKFGGPKLSDSDVQAWAAQPLGFSLIGVPGADPGTAFTAIPLSAGAQQRGRAAEQLTGYLQINPATSLYTFAFGRYVPFRTETSTTTKDRTIEVGGKPYNKPLAPSGGPGFHVLALDPVTLNPVPDSPELPAETVFYVSAPGGVQSLGTWLAAMRKRPERPLIVVQSFLSPAPTQQDRDRVALQIEALGGTRAIFNQLDGKRDYALIGRPGGVMPVAESPGTTAAAPISGVISPTTTSSFEPLLTQAQATDQGANIDMLLTAYQTAQPFKDFAAAGERGANAALAKSLDFLDKTDVRKNYPIAFRSTDWSAKAGRAASTTYAAIQSTCGCTEAEFTNVRDTLVKELYDVAQVKAYVTALQAPLDSSVVKQYINLQKIGDQVIDALKPPPADNTTSNGFLLASYIVKLGQFIPGAGATASAGLSALFGLTAFLTTNNGSPTLTPQLQAKVGDLTTQILQRYDTARSASTTFGLLAVSDAGKLRAVAGKSTSDERWLLPDDPGVSPAVETAASRSFYAALLPIGYRVWWLQGSSDPPTFRCSTPFSETAYRYPWQGLGPSAWATFPAGDGPRTYALATEFVDGPSRGPVKGPPAALIDSLTAPAPPFGKGMGFSKFELYNPKVFAPRVTENNADCRAQQGPFTLRAKIFGQGKIVSSDGRLDCRGGTCELSGIERGVTLTLTATPTKDRTFLRGWGDDCARERERATCTITFRRDYSVTAEFR